MCRVVPGNGAGVRPIHSPPRLPPAFRATTVGGLVAVEHRRTVAGARISPGTGLGFVLPVSHAVRARRPLACARYIRPIAQRFGQRAGLGQDGLVRAGSGVGGRGGGGGELDSAAGRRAADAATIRSSRAMNSASVSACGSGETELRGRRDRRRLPPGADGNDHQVKHRDRPVWLPVWAQRPVRGCGRVQLGPLPAQ